MCVFGWQHPQATLTSADVMDDEDAMADDSTEDDAVAASWAHPDPACAAVPSDGEGSFAGVTDDTAGAAASNNPLLSTLGWRLWRKT